MTRRDAERTGVVESGGPRLCPVYGHCWARLNVDQPLYCGKPERESHVHSARRRGTRSDTTWSEDACEANAGVDGHETRALQILELTWQLDFLSLHSVFISPAYAVRAVASRLFYGTGAARHDLRRIERKAASLRDQIPKTPEEHARLVLLAQARILDEVARRLYLFAGGSDNPATADAPLPGAAS